MKKIVLGIMAVAAVALVSFKGVEMATADYKVDTKKTDITWLAKKVTGEHTGKIMVKSGVLKMEGNKLVGGMAEIDMNSITCTDLTDAEWNGKLVGHIKSDDFFGVATFPTAKLEITEAKSTGKDTYNVSGNITIKGKTDKVSFPATVKMTGTTVSATGKMTIDRSKFDVKYGSSKFFEGLGDKMIYDEFTLDINLTATK